jgi:hypothetical protein
VRAIALVIWLLSKQCKLAGLYIDMTRTGTSMFKATDLDEEDLCPLMLDFMSDAATRHLVEIATDDPEHRLRVKADDWLVRSLVAECIIRANESGKSMQPAVVIATYLRYWSYRPIPISIRPLLTKLTYHAETRKNFLRRLRGEWGFRPGPLPPPRCLSVDETTTVVA